MWDCSCNHKRHYIFVFQKIYLVASIYLNVAYNNFPFMMCVSIGKETSIKQIAEQFFFTEIIHRKRRFAAKIFQGNE